MDSEEEVRYMVECPHCNCNGIVPVTFTRKEASSASCSKSVVCKDCKQNIRIEYSNY